MSTDVEGISIFFTFFFFAVNSKSFCVALVSTFVTKQTWRFLTEPVGIISYLNSNDVVELLSLNFYRLVARESQRLSTGIPGATNFFS